MSNSNSSGYSDSESDEEPEEEYCKGGYHPVKIGDSYNSGRYDILQKLGWGHFSTVWLARDTLAKEDSRKVCALKIVKSAEHYTETANDEILLLQKVNTASNSFHKQFIVSLFDTFILPGPNGNHVCMSFEVLGPNLLHLIKKYNHKGIPTKTVQRITKQILMGLEYLHDECGIIHTDLKPENVLVGVDVVESIRTLGLYDHVYGDVKLVVPEPVKVYESDSAEFLRLELELESGKLTANQKKKLKTRVKKLKERIATKYPGAQHGEDINMERQDSSVESVSSSLFESQPSSPVQYRAELPTTPPSMTQTTLRLDEDTGSRAVSSSDITMPPAEQKNDIVLEPRMLELDLLDDLVGSTSAQLRLSSPSPGPSSSPQLNVKIADLGNACWTHKHFTSDIQTRQYRSPEIILGAKYDSSCDIWSLGCMIFELLTGDFMFDPKTGARYSKDDDHITQIIELVGPFPRNMTQTGKHASEIFNRKGELKHIHKLRFWPLKDVFYDKYRYSREESVRVSKFILKMVEISPGKRARAVDMIDDDWLDGVTVERD